MKENECNVFEEKAKQNSEMELKRINEIKEKLECDLNITEDEMRDMSELIDICRTSAIVTN